MRRWKWLWFVGLLAVCATAVVMILSKSRSAKDEAAYQEQLRLARAEGIPTSPAEYRALIPTAAPSENAAPLYRQLRGLIRAKTEPDSVDRELIFRPNEKSLAAAQALLQNNRQALEKIDAAVLLPKCWFDRAWSQGAAVLMPEYAEMKTAAKLVALRGSVAANRGDVEGALEASRQIFVIAKHAGGEPHAIGRFLEQADYVIALRHLCYWAFMHRDQPAYANEFRKALDGFPRPNLCEEHLTDLSDILWLVDASMTPGGRAKIGLKEGDLAPSTRLIPLLLSQSKARIQIVKAQRDYWAALKRPQKERAALLDKATQDLYKGLFAFPTAFAVYTNLSAGNDGVIDREPSCLAGLQMLIAAERALHGNGIARSINTKDLPSPYDGKPLSYRYDGKQIVIGVSGYENESKPVLMKIPPDKFLGK